MKKAQEPFAVGCSRLLTLFISGHRKRVTPSQHKLEPAPFTGNNSGHGAPATRQARRCITSFKSSPAFGGGCAIVKSYLVTGKPPKAKCAFAQGHTEPASRTALFISLVATYRVLAASPQGAPGKQRRAQPPGSFSFQSWGGAGIVNKQIVARFRGNCFNKGSG